MRRAKLYYLKEKTAREIRKKTKQEAQVKKAVETPAEQKPDHEEIETAAR